MKINVTFALDSELLKKFIEVVEEKNSTPDEAITEAMTAYINNNRSSGETENKNTGDKPPEPPEDYVALTEKVLASCRKRLAVGQLANILLRGLLERGVATDWEIGEMQKASGNAQRIKFHVDYGFYNNDNFATSFPLLITEFQRDNYDVAPRKYRVNPLYVGNQKFFLSAQWYDHNREPLENWIRDKLPTWFKNKKTTNEQREEMKKFLERI